MYWGLCIDVCEDHFIWWPRRGWTNWIQNLCAVFMTHNDLCACIALTKWNGPVACVKSPKMLKIFKVNAIILPQPKPLRHYQWSNMNMIELPATCFLLILDNKDDITVVAQNVRDLRTTAAGRPSQRRDWNASVVRNLEFSNTNLEICFLKLYGTPDRHLWDDALKSPKLTQDRMYQFLVFAAALNTPLKARIFHWRRYRFNTLRS